MEFKEVEIYAALIFIAILAVVSLIIHQYAFWAQRLFFLLALLYIAFQLLCQYQFLTNSSLGKIYSS